MADTVKVISNRTRNRVLFEGTRADAEQYVRDNFPRNHVEPGNRNDDEPSADVSIQDGSNLQILADGEFVNGDEFGNRKAKPVSAPAKSVPTRAAARK